jgi:hypothetical protein
MAKHRRSVENDLERRNEQAMRRPPSGSETKRQVLSLSYVGTFPAGNKSISPPSGIYKSGPDSIRTIEINTTIFTAAWTRPLVLLHDKRFNFTQRKVVEMAEQFHPAFHSPEQSDSLGSLSPRRDMSSRNNRKRP